MNSTALSWCERALSLCSLGYSKTTMYFMPVLLDTDSLAPLQEIAFRNFQKKIKFFEPQILPTSIYRQMICQSNL